MPASSRIGLVSSALLGAMLSACMGGSPLPEADDAPTAIPPAVHISGGVVLVTSESGAPDRDEFESGVGVGGQIKLGPDGCLAVGMDEGARRSRLLLLPASSRLESDVDGDVVVRIGAETFAIGDAFEGGRSMGSPEGKLQDVYPHLADEVPEACRTMDVFVVDAPLTHPAPPGGPLIALAETWDAYPYARLARAKLRVRQGCLLVDGRVSIWPYGSSFDREQRVVVTNDGRRLPLTRPIDLGGGSYGADTDFSSWMGDAVGSRIKSCFERTGAPAARIAFVPR